MFTNKPVSRKFSASIVFAVLLALTLSALGVAPAQAAGTIRFVKPGGAGDCAGWAAACDLQTALTGAAGGDEIWVAAGTYKPTTSSTDRTATFTLKDGVALYGGFAGTETARDQRDFTANLTILSGDIDNNDSQTPVITDITTVTGNTANSYHVVTSAVSATLDGFTITAGNPEGCWSAYDCQPVNDTFASSGGGMYNTGNPTLANVTFSGNSTGGSPPGGSNGGGMYNSGNPTLTNVTFRSNAAANAFGSGSGGGGGLYNTGNPTLTNVTFSDNRTTGSRGGGMYTTGNPTLANVAFSNNSATNGSGGGMYNDGSPTLTNVTFSDNSATNGSGGGMSSGGSPTLINVTFSGNSATDGGGGMINYGSSTLINVVFRNNSTTTFANEIGGGGLVSFGDPILMNVTFSGNSSAWSGGGMTNDGGSPTLTNVTFSGNSASFNGGGMDNHGAPTLTNVTFSGNSANNGGGIYNETASSLTLTNVTLSNNSATAYGGGIYNDEFMNSSPQVRDTIFWGNTAITAGAQVYTTNNTPPTVVNDSVIQDGCPEGTTCANIISADPLLGALGDYGGLTQTVPLLAGSSAIDSGNDATCAAADQRGATRPAGAHCDIGAYEYEGTPRPDTTIDTHPASATNSPDADFTFSNPYGPATFECSLDGVAFEACSSPWSDTGLAVGSHTFAVRARNLTGDEDLTPASFAWTIYAPHTAGVRYAAPVTPGAGDCNSWGTACALQDALLTSVSGDEIWVAAGTHNPTAGTDRSITFQLKNGVALYGGFAGTETARDQRDFTANLTLLSGEIGAAGNSDNSLHVVTGASGATLDGFTVTAGNAGGWIFSPNAFGGGMYNNGSSPTLANVIFSGNSANQAGGGMYNDSSSNPTLTAVTFSANSSGEGGGMYNDGGSSPTLTDVTFNGNSAGNGAGIYNWNGRPALTNVTFTANTASRNGGGLCNWGSDPTLTNVTFRNNSARDGGGMYGGGDSVLTNVTFSGNSATDNGGGMYGGDSSVLTNVTFSGNSATNNGGGMYNEYSDRPTLTNTTFHNNSASQGGGMYNYHGSNPQIRNTILWGNTGAQIYNSSSIPVVNNSVVQGGCPAGATCTNVLTGDPMLGALGDYGGFTQTISLLPGSSAINTGNPAYCTLGHDQRGVSYVGVCDIGAYESDSAVSPTATITPTVTTTPTVTLTPSPTRTFVPWATPTTAQFPLGQASDDDTQCSGASQNEIYLGKCSGASVTSGFSFPNVAIPQGAQIISASMRWTVDGTYGNDISVAFYGEASGNAQTFSAGSLPASRALTNASTNWLIPASDVWTSGQTRTTPDLGGVIDEIVNRPDWSSGNRLAIIVKDASAPGAPNNHRRVFAYERAGAASAAWLVVTYLDTGTPTSTVTPTPTVTETITLTPSPSLSPTGAMTVTETPTPTITLIPMSTSTATPTQTITLTPMLTATITPTSGVKTLTFFSVPAQDGWVLESSETGNTGGSINTIGNLYLGDDAAKKQYRGILSFSTGSLPDNAVITGVTLKVRQQAIFGGGNPVSIFGGFMFDVKNGFFGTAALQPGDFQAAAGKSYGPFNTALVGGWYSINLTGAGPFVNKLATGSGLTQIRLRFKLDDNNNAVANILSLYSGNAPAGSQPQLAISYYAP